MSDDREAAAIGELLAVIVHDLRNPIATVGANLSFVKSSEREDDEEDLAEALADVEDALQNLTLGLSQVAWIGRWLENRPPIDVEDGDVVKSLEAVKLVGSRMKIERRLPERPLPARGGGATLVQLVQVLLANSVRHARRGTVVVSAVEEGEHVVVEVTDGGAALAPSLHDSAFTLTGQTPLRARVDGRYGPVAGLLAARIVADAIGAHLEAGGEDGAAVFRIRLRRLE